MAVALAVVLPLLAFGPAQALKLSMSWVNEILYTVSDAGRAHAPLSLHKSAAALLGAAPTASESKFAARGVQLLWLALVAIYFVIPARLPGTGDVARLCDVIVMLMLPLPISSWLVPYHGSVMLPAYILIVSVLIDAQRPQSLRIVAGIACAGCVALRFALPAWELRAGTLTLSLMLTLAALAAIRISLGRTAASPSAV
jgi:hypothetical protein